MAPIENTYRDFMVRGGNCVHIFLFAESLPRDSA